MAGIQRISARTVEAKIIQFQRIVGTGFPGIIETICMLDTLCFEFPLQFAIKTHFIGACTEPCCIFIFMSKDRTAVTENKRQRNGTIDLFMFRHISKGFTF